MAAVLGSWRENHGIHQRSSGWSKGVFLFIPQKPLDPTGQGDLSGPALKLRTALKTRDFPWIFNGFCFFFLLPWRRGTGRDLQGDPCSHQDTSLIPQKENPSEGQLLPLPPWSCFYWIHLHLQSLGEPSRLEMHTSNRKTEGNPFLTLPAPGLSLQSPTSSSTAKTPAWGASQESLIWTPRLQRGFFSNSTLFSDGLDKIQGDGDPRRKEWGFFFWGNSVRIWIKNS